MRGEWVVAVFPSREALTEALDSLKALKAVRIRSAAIVAKAEGGEVVVVDDKIGPDEGGIAGGTLAMAIAALGMVQLGALSIPGVGMIVVAGGALVGAIVGSLTARLGASLLGMNESPGEAYYNIADQLRAGNPALVLALRDSSGELPLVREALQQHGGEIVRSKRATALT